jgi:hypothetical protein
VAWKTWDLFRTSAAAAAKPSIRRWPVRASDVHLVLGDHTITGPGPGDGLQEGIHVQPAVGGAPLTVSA